MPIRLSQASVIGLAGRKFVGKDTTANYLEYLYPTRFHRYAFADPMKAALK
jgi:hypothetical protein